MSKQQNFREPFRSRVVRRILTRYFLILGLSVVGLMGVLMLVFWLATMMVHQYIWQPDDLLYRVLKKIQDNLLLVVSILLCIDWSVVTYRYMVVRLMRYLDEVVEASKSLAQPESPPLVLSGELKEIQDELNLVREQSQRNAAMAREAEQRKNDMIVYLAHDLKTPLTSVIGYLSLLQEAPELPVELRVRYTGIALNKAMRLEDLINEFFEITRFNLTALELETERTNFSRMLEQIASEFFPVLEEKQLSWQLDIQPNVEMVLDCDKMERVFDNLIRNAVAYSYPGSPIWLMMRQSGEMVQVVVQNHGRTIPPEKLSRIFEQFFRLDSSRASSTGGAGLGLAIAKEIIELHGGRIEASSARESIRFTVTLPIKCQKIV